MQIRLRAVEKRDFDDVRAMAEAFHGEDGHPIDAKSEAAALILSLGAAEVRAWLAICGGRTVGCVVVSLRADADGSGEAAIEEPYAVPGNRNAMAGAMLDEICRKVAGLGVSRIFVALQHSDAAGRSYFSRHGIVTLCPGAAIKVLP